MSAPRTVIVGAGVAGLAAARELTRGGAVVIVLEADSRVGGRLASPAFGGAVFDDGAQFFTARSERFRAMADDWLRAGTAVEWSRGFADADGRYEPDGRPRYSGAAGMESLARDLARDLDIRHGQRVERVERAEGGWRIVTTGGESHVADAVILALPVPSGLNLLDAGRVALPAEARGALDALEYDPCISVLAALDGPSGVPKPGGVQLGTEPVRWLADNQRKGISAVPAVTIHAATGYSRERWAAADAEIVRELVTSVRGLLTADVGEARVSRWRYSQPREPRSESCLLALAIPALVFAGDAFGDAKVEGAALSGLAAAERVLASS